MNLIPDLSLCIHTYTHTYTDTDIYIRSQMNPPLSKFFSILNVVQKQQRQEQNHISYL